MKHRHTRARTILILTLFLFRITFCLGHPDSRPLPRPCYLLTTCSVYLTSSSSSSSNASSSPSSSVLLLLLRYVFILVCLSLLVVSTLLPLVVPLSLSPVYARTPPHCSAAPSLSPLRLPREKYVSMLASPSLLRGYRRHGALPWHALGLSCT